MSLSKDKQLYDLVKTRDYLKVKTCMERNNCDVNAQIKRQGLPKRTTCLHVAAANGDIAIVQLLLDHQAHVDWCDEWGKTALDGAARHGHTDVVSLLIEYKKVDVYEVLSIVGELHRAAMRGHTDIVNFLLHHHLLHHHADVNKTDCDGMTTLHWAARGGHTDTVKYLLDHHADVNKAETSFGGMTALHWVAVGGHTDTVTLLLDNGADHTARDDTHRTPLDLARQYIHHDTVSAIERFISHSQQVSCVNISELQENVDMASDDDTDEEEFKIVIQRWDDHTDEEEFKIVSQPNHSVPNQQVQTSSVLSGYTEVTLQAYVKGDMSEMLLPQWVPSANDNKAASVVGVPYKRVDDPNRVITLPNGQLPSHQPAIQGKPTEKELSDLAQNLGFEWSRLAIELGLSSFEVDRSQMSFPGDADRQIRAMLIKWRQRSGGQSEAQRYHNLRKALKNVGRNDLAQNIEN